ncbi:MAG TPA: alpha-glucosidase [Candidatus Jeotgalibaca merdavium]|uniref:Alpha-glucosidase n=1 Tax=Candidatus Jeotgalibaca merdavium TaxID=2838627 RepID=A0A9D2KW86_9LACT|nr:alpha-glucosidase [Candidatus Jeotgalibaca merdavium]
MEHQPWWHETILYQIYPMSFQDSNADGVGDIPGIIKRLDYIQSLGVNMIWLNPIFASPKVDNGYDVSNYMAIDPQFGTMADVEQLIHEAHIRGIKVIFDLILNHTSDQHPWFQEAIKGRDNPYRDYYIWHDGKNNGQEPPNNWEGFFRGSVWEKEPSDDQYYFHLFAKEMPDLNWENPDVHRALEDICFFWLDKGIDGFRVDAFIHIQKEDGFPDLDLPKGEIAIAEQYYANLPKVNTYMKIFTSRLRERFPDIFIVGEAASADVHLARTYSDPNEGGCNSVITFRYFPVDEESKDWRLNGNMQRAPLLFDRFKETMNEWQEEMSDIGGPTLYWNNHDMARVVSRVGDDHIYRDNSAKMLATLMYLQKGIPVIYNGEEIGMKNLYIDNIEDFNSPEADDFYKKALEYGYTREWVLHNMRETSKDAGRGAMQWNDSEFAGFSEVKPWSGVNIEPSYTVKSQTSNPTSILVHYKKVLDLKRTELFIYGDYRLIETSPELYVYEREYHNKLATVICNVTDQPQLYPLSEEGENDYRRVILENEGVRIIKNHAKLSPYGAVVLLTDFEDIHE